MMSQNAAMRQGYAAGSSLVSSGGPTARATVIIKLPTDARLYADNKALALTGPERTFVSPGLPQGQEFAYRFRVEYDRNGETLSVTRKVAVRAGGMVTVEFNDMTVKSMPEKNAGGGNASVAATPTSTSTVATVPTHTQLTTTTATGTTTSSVPNDPAAIPVAAPASAPQPPTEVVGRATIRVKMPPGATLYVDDQRSPSTELVRQFSTPPLPAGKEYAYLMKAEVLRNGQMETVTQRVPFRAGERVDVDFTLPVR
jgi:uncharacterized protein (TIGR03000 family)